MGFGLAFVACAPAHAMGLGRRPIDDEPWTCTETTGHIVTLSVPSAAYNRPVAASVYEPPCYDWSPGPLPVIYLLHGGGADETQWPDLNVRTEADALIAQGAPPFVVVMPGGLYRQDVDYGAFILNDLLPGVEGRLRVSTDGAGRAIGGISLGGYWALKIAFQHPDLFAAVGGHSPVITQSAHDDPSALGLTAPGLERLAITLDAGDLDSLRASTEQFAAALRGRGLAVTLTISPGGHNRPYWRAHTGDYLQFYLAALAPRPVAAAPSCHQAAPDG